MKTQLFVLMLLVCLGGCSSSQAQEKLAPKTYQAKLKSTTDAQLIDVRTPQEYKAGHITNAKNINVYDSNFAVQCAKLDKNKPVFVYCKRGPRSGRAASQLKQLGFKKIYDLSGGITAWSAQGLKTVK